MTDASFDQSIGDFLDAIASDAPVPGGGSVSSYTAAAGMALVVMALEVSIKKAEDTAPFTALIDRGRTVIAELKTSLVADIDCFSTYMATLKMPKGTEEEIAARKTAMGQAAVTSTAVPVAAAAHCVEGLKIAVEARAICRPTILSDVYAGANLLEASCRSILLNVDANLGSIPSEAERSRYAEAKAELLKEAAALLAKAAG
ncbi:cyclodeaminase/cyclohydrolase family protein [Thalassobaculum sp.]|uniref:cyclodeaminase/cyclohydrolase family protein n=1 Tax=Thalassobaculum sp. TaxID=2022740 RepID=UPI003B5B10BC